MRILDYGVREPISNETLERVEMLQFPKILCDDESGCWGSKIEENNHNRTRFWIIPISC